MVHILKNMSSVNDNINQESSLEYMSVDTVTGRNKSYGEFGEQIRFGRCFQT